MKLIAFTLTGFLMMAGAGRAQQTEVQVQNGQIKIEVTTNPESCAADSLEKENPNIPSPAQPCKELAITNNSRMSITAWVSTTERESSGGARRLSSMGIRSEDNAVFGEDSRMSPPILSHDTHRVDMGNATRVKFRAAIFEDGSIYGDPDWVNRIVQNRRQVYQDVADSLQKLRASAKAETPREEVVREFRELDRDQRERDYSELRDLPRAQRLRLPRLDIYGMVALDLEPTPAPGGGGLIADINQVESSLLGIAQRLLVSEPPIADHPVLVGEPLADASPPERPSATQP
jgi:hypothetical protein